MIRRLVLALLIAVLLVGCTVQPPRSPSEPAAPQVAPASPREVKR